MVTTSLFTYYAMPIVSAFTPPTGPVQGGTLLTLTGAKLDGGGLGGHTARLGVREALAKPAELLLRLGCLLLID